MNVVDYLLDLDLPPGEFKAAAFILRQTHYDDGSIDLPTHRLATAMGVTERQARRIIDGLISAGFMSRRRRGEYFVPAYLMSANGTEMSSSRTEMSDAGYVSTASHDYMARETSNDVSLGGYAPESGTPSSLKGIDVVRYSDDGDDLAGVGRTEPKPEPKRKKGKPPALHREVPREEWDMAYVTKEFRHRLTLSRKWEAGVLMSTNTQSLLVVLRQWQRDFGLTPQQAADLCDRFFDDAVIQSRITNAVPAYKHYLHFIQTHIDTVRPVENVLDEDFRARVRTQPKRF